MTVIIILILNACAVHAQAPKSLSLADIKTYAVANNFGVKAETAKVDEAKAQTQVSRAPFYPKLSAVTGPEIQSDANKRSTETLGYLEGKWNIFRGAADRLNVEIGQLNQSIAESNLKRAQFELELAVEDLFYRYLALSTKLQHFGEALETNDRHRGYIRKKRQSGMASQADTMEFELRDSFLKSEINVITQDREEARIGLIRLMGPNVTAFEPQGALPHMHLKIPLSKFLSQINSTSELVKASSLKSAVGSIGQKAARSGWLPAVDLETRYGRLQQGIAPELEGPAFYGTLLLKWEFFSGFETTGKILEAKARASQFENEFRQRLLTAMSDAEISYGRLKSIEERVHVEERNEANAAIYYKSVLEEYRRGIKNGADLKIAEDTLLQSHLRASDFKYKFLSDKIQLEKAIGLFIETKVHAESGA